MKKGLITLISIFLVIIIVIIINYNNYSASKRKIIKYNSEYELFNKNEVSGIDITSLINKAISSNEKNGVEKDSDGLYINNGRDSVQIFIKMIINNNTYPMEKIYEIGMESFNRSFGIIKFKCVEVTYHKDTSKIATMLFETIQY